MKKKNIIFIASTLLLGLLILIILLFPRTKSPLDVDISDINIEVEFERFDQDFLTLKKDPTIERVLSLKNKYGEFFQIYNHQIISIGGIENQSYLMYVRTFLSDYAVGEAYKKISEVFDDSCEIDQELSLAFRYFNYHFPNLAIPRVIAFNGGFNQSITTYDNYIGVGLDKYLGKECELYDMLQIPEFARVEMMPERIPIDVLRAYAMMEFPYNDSVENLINKMIYNGVILYFLDACFPHYSDMLKIAYNEYQIGYCRNFENDMWTYLVSNQLLFSTDHLTIRKFTESAPFTSDFGNDSPPRTGNWLGWQIVRSFMEANPTVSVADLMNETNYQKILNQSQYNP